jgi:hypothetical protein
MHLVDTNVLSEARRGNHEARTRLGWVDPVTMAWLEQLLYDRSDGIIPISDRLADATSK